MLTALRQHPQHQLWKLLLGLLFFLLLDDKSIFVRLIDLTTLNKRISSLQLVNLGVFTKRRQKRLGNRIILRNVGWYFILYFLNLDDRNPLHRFDLGWRWYRLRFLHNFFVLWLGQLRLHKGDFLRQRRFSGLLMGPR